MIERLKKYLPIKIHHIMYSYGWWIGDKFIFFEKHWIPFNVMPMSLEYKRTTFAKGKNIDGGSTKSWDNYEKQF